MTTGKGYGEIEMGREGAERKEGVGDRGWRGGAREGAKIGWLMFYATWSQLIYVVSCIMGREEKEVRMGRQGWQGKYREGAKVGWLMLFNDTLSQ